MKPQPGMRRNSEVRLKRTHLLVVASVAFVAALTVSLENPTPAYAAGSCSLAPIVCANDSSPGCETICGGDEQAHCTEGSCTAAGNVAAPNLCECK
jgi:hypothetical protein